MHDHDTNESADPFFGFEPKPSAFRRPFRLLSRLDESRLVLPVAAVLSRVDLLMSRPHARRLRETLHHDYRLMHTEAPGLFRLPGATDLAASHLLGLGYDSGHYFAYVPRTAVGEKLGLMVFLHGNAGNFRLLIWRWRNLAERARLAIVAPSYGFGFWGGHSSRIIEAAVADTLGRWPAIDPDQGSWLAGLSAGGNGVVRAAADRHWHGLIFLSATMRLDLMRAPDFVDRCKGRRVIVLNGLKDHNVWPRSVDRGVEFLRSREAEIEHHVYNEEDHFMTFAQARDVDERLFRWMNGAQGQPLDH